MSCNVLMLCLMLSQQCLTQTVLTELNVLTIESIGFRALCCVWILLSSCSPKQQLEQLSSLMLLPLWPRPLQFPHHLLHQALLTLCQLLSLHHLHQMQLLMNLHLWVVLKKRRQQKKHLRHRLLSVHHQLTGMNEHPKLASLSISVASSFDFKLNFPLQW